VGSREEAGYDIISIDYVSAKKGIGLPNAYFIKDAVKIFVNNPFIWSKSEFATS